TSSSKRRAQLSRNMCSVPSGIRLSLIDRPPPCRASHHFYRVRRRLLGPIPRQPHVPPSVLCHADRSAGCRALLTQAFVATGFGSFSTEPAGPTREACLVRLVGREGTRCVYRKPRL